MLLFCPKVKDAVVDLDWSAGKDFKADAEFDSTNDNSCAYLTRQKTYRLGLYVWIFLSKKVQVTRSF